MHTARNGQPTKLEELPNIGKSIASDLRAIGILLPQQLAGRDPLATYIELGGVMGHRHDPCVLYTLISVQHFLESGEALPWWTFTGQGKQVACDNYGRWECVMSPGRTEPRLQDSFQSFFPPVPRS